jgi:hypothetical protein
VRHAAWGRTAPYLLAAVALVVLALALAPRAAVAHDSYRHGGIDDCEMCHESGHTDRTPLSFVCFTCHSRYQVVRSSQTCWTCHMPGEDMSWARTDASCLSTCHLRSGDATYDVPFTHTPHAGGSAACTSCHPLSASAAESAGSTHHTVPAPRLDLVTPSAGAPGASVTLTGAKLSWVTLVRFGGVRASFTILSDTSVKATVPVDAVSGPVTVVSGGGLATGPADFVVLRPEPPQPPVLTLSASRRTVALGSRVKLVGSLAPFAPSQLVRVDVQRRASGSWKAAASSSRPLGAGGAYSWAYRPRHAGAYRARASVTGVVSGWVSFRVR